MWHAFAGHQAVYKQVHTRELDCQGWKGSITLYNDDAAAVASRLAAGAAEGTLSIFSNNKGQTLAGIWSGDRRQQIISKALKRCAQVSARSSFPSLYISKAKIAECFGFLPLPSVEPRNQCS